MIMRLYLLLGLLLLGGTGYFIVVDQPPTFQAAPVVAEQSRLRDEGVLPPGPFAENDEVEHGIFDVPPKDEEMLAEAMANMDMGGMDMSGMDMSGSGTMDMSNADTTAGGDSMEMADGATMDMSGGAVDTLDMDMDGDGVMDMSSAAMGNGTTMDMGEGSTMAEGAAGTLDMDMDGDGVMDMSSAAMSNGATMDMGESNSMAMGGADQGAVSEEEADRLKAGMMAGLVIRDEGAFDREISLSMSEWTFSDLKVDAKPGERIKFTLRNDGQILHEFMFMSMAAMQAVNYRAKRADWNLLEHEALFEKSLMLPGDEITFVVQVTKPGVWMFMCMLPYHMQMGMMGQLATEGMAMDM